jgi:hypothetical protein
MSTTNPNWTAFPFQITLPNADGKTETTHYNAGMTLRDYFAAKAMQSLLSSDYGGEGCNGVAIDAYDIADAMMKAREA